MRDYREAYARFSLAELEREVLIGSLAGGSNACIECCDRWAMGERIALRWIGRDGTQATVTYAALRDDACRFANLLADRGIGSGDVVAALLPRIPELLVVVLGTWRAGAIYQPLFTAFGPTAIEHRIAQQGGSAARLVVTDATNRVKLDDVANAPPVLVVDRERPEASSFAAELAAQNASSEPALLRGDDPFLMIFTSGTTGHPKGVAWPIRMLLAISIYMRDGLDLRESDVFWNMADPGWAYGMAYTIVGPLLIGHATTMYDGPFTVESTLRLIAEQGVTNLAAAPTVYRLLMAAGDAAVAPLAGRLRVASSAGEPLNPQVVRWGERVLACNIADHYGQTEVAMVINNHHGVQHPRKPGSAGLAMRGFSIAVLDDALRPVAPETPGVLGVHRTRSPLFCFTGYWSSETENLRGDWYITGDTMKQDEDGFLYFVGRADDVITSSGYRIGPFDVESTLIEHPSVAEVAVVGKPDPERTELVKAFVVLRVGHEPSAALTKELQDLVRTRLSAHAFPREVAFIAELPKTPSGKVQRFLLRQRS